MPTTERPSARRCDVAQVRRVARLGGLELITATYHAHTFPPHLHDTFVIELVEGGVDEFVSGGNVYCAPAGSIILINPKEVHTGRSVGREPLRYRSLYPSASLLSDVAQRLGGRSGPTPFFAEHVIVDDRLAARLGSAHRSLERDVDSPTAAATMLGFLSELTCRHAEFRSPTPEPALLRAWAYLIEHISDNTSLRSLAEVVGVSPFHLARCFRKAFGLPPHEFLVNARVEHARRLLARGRSIAQVLGETGFADQSHLTRCFRSRVGLTPGRFQKSKIVQDP